MVAITLGRRELQKAERRGRIVAAARALFRHKGFEGATIQEIAEAAGISVGAVFNYAKSKEDLLILVFHDEICELVDKAYLAVAADAPLQDQVLSFFSVIADYFERDVALARALMRALGYMGSDEQRSLVDNIMTATDRRLEQLIEAAKVRVEVAPETPAAPVARALFALYHVHQIALTSEFFDRARFDWLLRTDIGFFVGRLR